MSGYPPVDREAFTRSIVLNGYLAWRLASPVDPYADPSIVTPQARRTLLTLLARRPDRRFRWLSDNSALLSFPVTPCGSLRHAVDRLTAEHQPHHWYRGQSQQYVAVYEGQLPSIGNVRLAFDALMPSYFRRVTTPVPAEWDGAVNTQDRPSTSYVAGALRAMMRSQQDEMRRHVVRFLGDIRMASIARALSRQSGWAVSHPESESQWLAGTNLGRSQLDLIALAQHYEFGSVMVDVTNSVDVASWFASRRYADGTVIVESRSPGIIYRFNKHQIDEVLRTRFVVRQDSGPGGAARTLLPQLGLFGLVDISQLPAETARRPGAQRGGSLFGFENSVLHLMLCEGAAVEAFTFPHAPSDADVSGLTKAQLCPPDDPALATFDASVEDGAALSPDELDTFLRDAGVADDEREHLVHLLREGVL